MSKRYRLAEADLEPIADGRGMAIATDRIIVDGQPVGHMVREAPAFRDDSGWRFTAGDEDDAYASDPDHWGVVDINLVANCDPEVATFLEAPVGSRVVRWPAGTALRLNPTHPAADPPRGAVSGGAGSGAGEVVTGDDGTVGGDTASTGDGSAARDGIAGTGDGIAGTGDGAVAVEAPVQRQALGSDWWIDLPGRFAAGMVNNAIHLVATRQPMRTVWVDIWTPQAGDGGAAGRLAADIRAAARPSGAREFDEPGSEPGEIRIGYWYQEAAGAEGVPRHWTLYAYTIRPTSFVQAVFMAASPDPDWALAAWRSLRYAPATT